MTTAIHHGALPVRNFLSLSKLCPLVCPRWPLSTRGWEREQAHLFNHNARVWKQFLPQPCFLKAKEAQTSLFLTSIFYSPSISPEHLTVNLSFPTPDLALGNSVTFQILAQTHVLWRAFPNTARPGQVPIHLIYSPYLRLLIPALIFHLFL